MCCRLKFKKEIYKNLDLGYLPTLNDLYLKTSIADIWAFWSPDVTFTGGTKENYFKNLVYTKRQMKTK